MKGLSFTIYNHTKELPKNWDDVAVDNVFLQKHYLEVLEKSAPFNMQCFYIAIFENEELIGVSLAQYLDLNKLESFGERDKCFKTFLRNIIFRNFGSHTLFLGNNMITGQNGYAFSLEIDFEHISDILMESTHEITNYFKNKNIKIHIVSFKDFYENCSVELKKYQFSEMYEFNSQPNMILYVNEKWKSKTDYIEALSKKYRDQYKRAHKKFDGIITRDLSLEEIVQHEETIYDLYHYVAQNAPFNTFFLPKNHFAVFKEQLQENFLFYGYFENEKLIGFNTLIKNGSDLDTYFLGYDDSIQREKMLYLNMLYDMIGYAVKEQFSSILFASTALEIKSSVGAKPLKMYGMMRHDNKFINPRLNFFFRYLEPEIKWTERHPFQD